MNIIQGLLIVFAAFGLAAAVSRWRRGNLSFRQWLPWACLWIGMAVVALRPETASGLAHRLGVGRGADVVVYLALVAVFYLLFRMLARLEEHERHLTKLARELALKDLNRDERP